MARICLFGATGGTGRQLLNQGLQAGHRMTVLVRDPLKLTLTHPAVRVIPGDVLRLADFAGKTGAQDIFISALGPRRGDSKQVYSVGFQHICQVMMSETGARRFLCISANGLEAHEGMGFWTRSLTRLVLQPLLKEAFNDLRIMEKRVKESTLDWTIFRPPRLTNMPRTGNFRVTVGSHISDPSSISRADLAFGMLRMLDDPATYRKLVELSY